MEHLGFGIIEQAGIPGGVNLWGAVLRLVAGEVTEALGLVLYHMGMDEINDHTEPKLVSGVDQPLQIIWGAKA